jgi:hypothetical protein
MAREPTNERVSVDLPLKKQRIRPITGKSLNHWFGTPRYESMGPFYRLVWGAVLFVIFQTPLILSRL